jgi:signal transduction histidine kinase/GAF domain-containing protein
VPVSKDEVKKMTVLDEALKLVTESPGNLVYYLVTLFSLEAMLAMVAGEWARGRRTPRVRRWLLASVGMFVTRAILMVVALLAWRGVLPDHAIIPPLERFMDAVVILFLGWAALSLSDEYPTIMTALFTGSLLAGLVGYAGAAFVWYRASTENPELVFNGFLQDTLWSAVTLGLLGLLILTLLVRRRSQWPLLLSATLLMTAGNVMHLVTARGSGLSVAPWIRLANLAAYPLLAGVVYRHVLDWQLMGAGLLRLGVDWEVLERIQPIGASLDMDTAVVTAISVVETALQAEVCALGLPAERTNRRMELALVRGSDRSTEPGTTFELDEHPLIKRAIRTRRQVALNDADLEMADLYAVLGEKDTGPLLIQPLIDDRVVVGVLIVGNPRSGRVWTEDECRMCTVLGQRLAMALGNAQRYQQITWRADQLARNLEMEEQRAGQVETALEQSKAEAQAYVQKTLELERQIERQDQQAQEMANVWQAMEDDTDLKALQNEIERLSNLRSDLEASLKEEREKARQLSARQAEMGFELGQALKRVEELENQDQQSQERSANGGSPRTCGIVVSDYTGQIAAVHGPVERFLNEERTGILTKPISELYSDPRWRQTLEKLMVDSEVRFHVVDSPQVVNVQHAHQSLRVELTPVPSPNQQGFNGIVAVVYPDEETADISYQAELLASLVQELRTPMTSIIGYTDLLLGESVGILGAMQRKFLQRVKANTERMSAKLDDLIEITAIDLGRLEIEPETVNIVSIIEEAIMNTAGQFRERGIVIDIALDDDLPEISADPDALNQVMLNLLSNACQASKAGSTVMVAANLHDTSDAVLGDARYFMVSVTDTGGGIPDEERRRVFTRLYRADNPLIKGLGETGVGLSVAKTLIEAHGGRIWVESEAEVGSTFSFLLPVAGPPAMKAGGDFAEATL